MYSMRFGHFFYFPFIRLLGLPVVDIHIYTGDCYTGVTLRVRGSILHRLQKNNTNRASPPGIRNQQRERERNSTRRKRGDDAESESLTHQPNNLTLKK